MADYRDDRGALRQRVEELESELERAERAKTALATALELERERARPQALGKGVGMPPLWALLLFVGLIASMAFVVLVVDSNPPRLAREGSEEVSREPVLPELPEPVPMQPMPTTEPAPPPAFIESPTCQCAGNGAASTLAYRMLQTPTPKDAGTSVIEASLVGARTIELRLISETAPPDSLASKKTRMLLACDAGHVVLAFGTRVTAWSRATGDVMWMATLPERVGSVEPGPFGIECTKLPVTAGAISLKHHDGTTRLSMADGEPVAP